MSRKHQSDPKDHPTHPVKGEDQATPGQVHTENVNTGTNQSTKDKMVDIGRGENTAGRQNHGN